MSTTLCAIAGDYPWELDCSGAPISVATRLESFVTPKRGKVQVTTNFALSVSPEQLIFIAKTCTNDPHLLVFYSDGTVDAAMRGYNFGQMKITQISYVDCGGI